MTSYYQAKRRRINKLVRETGEEIRYDYNRTSIDNIGKTNPCVGSNPVAAFSECLQDEPTTSDLPIDSLTALGSGPLRSKSDGVGRFSGKSARSEKTDLPEAEFESIGGDTIEPEYVFDPEEHDDNFLMTSLKYWATSFSISLVALSALLSILKVLHPTLPKDGRTLLGTQKLVPTTKMQGGEYYHFGIVKGVLSRLACLRLPTTLTTLTLQFNIDGLPLFKSSKLQFWPILGCLQCDYTKSPFVIGIFCGLSKPKKIFEYLEQFATELKQVLSNGIVSNAKRFKVQISSFICDAPARAYIKQTKAFNGYSGCDKCHQEGVWRDNKMAFPETKVRLRTDANFLERVDEEHHIGMSPLSSLVKMVSMFPIDYMHLCCLGVTRKLLNKWIKGKKKETKIGSKTVDAISAKLLNLRGNMPSEFNRKPRGLDELDRWKATELRSFMLYWGPVVLKDSLPSELYNNFMLFSVGMYLLLSPRISEEKLAFAHKLMVSFVEHFGALYGRGEIVYNVHQLIHLSEEYRTFGTLDNISGFPFENYLGQIKHLLRKPHQPLQQVVKRLSEIPRVVSPGPTDDPILQRIHFDGPVPPQFISSVQYRKVSTPLFTLSTKAGDNCIEVGDGVALVENIVQSEGHVYIIYRRYRLKQPYYTYPCESPYIGTCKVSGLHQGLGIARLDHIKRKCLHLPDGDGAIVIPLLHLAE